MCKAHSSSSVHTTLAPELLREIRTSASGEASVYFTWLFPLTCFGGLIWGWVVGNERTQAA